MQPEHLGADRFERALPSYRRTVIALAKQNFGKIPDMRIEDIENEFLEVLWRACCSYDPNRGAKFNTHFRNLIRNRVGHLLQHAFALKRTTNLHTETLTDDAVAWAVEELTSSPSAEEEMMAIFAVREYTPTRKQR